MDQKYSWYYTVQELGFKYHTNDINAAIGLVQLEKLNGMNQRGREIVDIYNENFGELEWLEAPVNEENAQSALHNYVVKVNDRDRFIQYLQDHGISASVHLEYPVFQRTKITNFCEAEGKKCKIEFLMFR